MSLENNLLQLNPRYRLQWEAAQNCHVLLYPEGLVRLSDTASEILKLFASPTSITHSVETLQQQYPDAITLRDDVHEFVEHALRQQWLVTAHNEGA